MWLGGVARTDRGCLALSPAPLGGEGVPGFPPLHLSAPTLFPSQPRGTQGRSWVMRWSRYVQSVPTPDCPDKVASFGSWRMDTMAQSTLDQGGHSSGFGRQA